MVALLEKLLRLYLEELDVDVQVELVTRLVQVEML